MSKSFASKMSFFVNNKKKNNLKLYSVKKRKPELKYKLNLFVLYVLSKNLLFFNFLPINKISKLLLNKVLQTLATLWSVDKSFVTVTITLFKLDVFCAI